MLRGERRRRAWWALGLFAAAACSLANPLGRYQVGGPESPDAMPTPGVEGVEGGAVDAGATWHRYAYSFGSGTWATPDALDVLWDVPNAPPPHGIVTAVELSDFPRLLIFANDGNYYLQNTSSGAWSAPQAIGKAWAPMSAPPNAGYHVPGAFIRSIQPDASIIEGITFFANPNAYLFSFGPDDAIGYSESRPLTQDDGGAPPEDKAIWSYELTDLGNADPAQHYKNFTLHEDGRVFEFWADFSQRSAPVAETLMWKGKAGAPAPATLTSAYYNQAKAIAYFIGP